MEGKVVADSHWSEIVVGAERDDAVEGDRAQCDEAEGEESLRPGETLRTFGPRPLGGVPLRLALRLTVSSWKCASWERTIDTTLSANASSLSPMILIG